MKPKRSSISKLYNPQYLKEKKEKQMIDEYIRLEGDNFIGKIGLATSEYIKWRAKAKIFKVIVDQTRLYEVRKIIKQYEFEQKEKKHQFTNDYIGKLNDLLSIKNQKKYLPLRLQMLKTKNVPLLTDHIMSSRAKTIERIKNQFYITSYNLSKEKVKHKNIDSIGMRTMTTLSSLNKNRVHFRTSTNDNDNQETIYSHLQYDVGRDEDNLIDPDRDNEKENMKNENFRINRLKSEYHFYTQPGNNNKNRKLIKRFKPHNENNNTNNCSNRKIKGEESLEFMSQNKRQFLHILDMRKKKENRENQTERNSIHNNIFQPLAITSSR